MSMRPDRSPVERWFMRRGIPHFIEGYAAGTDILTRVAPVLALVFVTEIILLSFGDRFAGYRPRTRSDRRPRNHAGAPAHW